MKGVDAVARALQAEGVEQIFCFPANTLIEAGAKVGIRPILARSEKVLINIADGFCRATNNQKPAVCVVQQGPGIENAFGAIAQAYGDSVPLLVLPGGPDQHRHGIPTGFDSLPSYSHITKWAGRINFADRVPELVNRAFTMLRNGQPAPVLLELPGDVAAADVDEASFVYRPARTYRYQADPAAVSLAATMLLSAKKPMIHAGQGVLWAQCWYELRELAELVQAPVMTTMGGKSALPENHPLALGTGGMTQTAAVAKFLRESDLVFGVGCSFTKGSFSTAIPMGSPNGKRLIQLTLTERDVNKDYPLDLALLGDAKLVLRQLLDEVKKQLGGQTRDGQAVTTEVRETKLSWLAEWMPRLTSEEKPINPYRVIWELNRIADKENTIVTHDSGNPRDQILTFYEAIAPRGYLGWGKSTQLGTSLGIAMGAKLAEPGKLVVNLMGDLAFGMAGMDVETAVREHLPIMTVIVNNSVLGGYSHHMPVASQRFDANKLSGRYCEVAKGLGAYSERIEDPSDVASALQRGIKATEDGQAVVLEFITKEEPVFSKF